MLKTKLFIAVAAIAALFLQAGCHDVEEFDNDALGNFDSLWRTIDTRYCLFAEKDVDWDEVGRRYRKKIIPGITDEEFFELCSDMLAELRDGHVNLSSPFASSYYRGWWSGYPANFDYRVVQQYYLDFDYRSIGQVDYKILPGNIGYVRYPSFSSLPGEGNLDIMLSYLSVCDALIIDVRDNGGGNLTNIAPFVSRLIHEKMTGGYLRHKTGPGHNDFSDPCPVVYEPTADHVQWNKPVAVLTNRKCYSAANDFVSVMKEIPGVIIVGAATGGGGGMPLSSELPNGWSLRFSAVKMTNCRDESVEDGVAPTEGCEAVSTPERLALGHDDILDKAISLLSAQQ